MKAYSDLAAELGRLSGREGGGRDEYVTKMRGSIKISPGGSRHFSMDHTGRSQIGMFIIIIYIIIIYILQLPENSQRLFQMVLMIKFVTY